MNLTSYYLFLLALFFGYRANAQTTLGSYNFAYQYKPDSEISLHHQSVQKSDSVKIYLRLDLHKENASIDDYLVSIHTSHSYTDQLEAVSQTAIDSSYAELDEQKHLLHYAIPSSHLAPIIVVQLESKLSGIDYFYDILPSAYPLMLFNIDGRIEFNPWLNPGVYNFHASNKELYGYFYEYSFPPALPPMPVKNDVPQKSMEIDSTFIAQGNENLWFTKPGLYLIQLDSTDRNGFSFRVENKHFPKVKKLENLIDPLIYITTNEENEKLQNIKGEKKEFDRFWLELTNSPDRAKNIIKNYFDHVEQANALFTTYKSGWKTDMGMIYIIFGPPDEVLKTVNGQSWHYFSLPQLPSIQFDFVKTETAFSTAHYVLIRDKKFTNAWYRTIDLWRKGRF